jgi:hypothetical protein
MICDDCKNKRHTLCRGGTWCNCLHRGLYDCLHCELSGLSYHEALVHEIAQHGRIDPDLCLDSSTGEVVLRKELNT